MVASNHDSSRMTDRGIDYTNLEVWRRSHALTLSLYSVTRTFPAEERFGLTSQLRRAAASVPTNIAEGRSRFTPRAYASFVDNAGGSAGEVSYLLRLSHGLEFVKPSVYEPLLIEAIEIRRMLGGLYNSIAKRAARKVSQKGFR